MTPNLIAIAEEIERFAEALYECSGIQVGDLPSQMLHKLGIELLRVKRLEGPEARCSSNGQRKQIFAPKALTGGDLEESIGHEIFEIMFENAMAGLSQEQKEDLRTRGGRALLLPRHLFRAAYREHGVNLLAMKDRFRAAPFYCIAARYPDLYPGFVSSRWDVVKRIKRDASIGLEVEPRFDFAELAMLGSLYGGGDSFQSTEAHRVQIHGVRTSSVRPNSAVLVCSIQG